MISADFTRTLSTTQSPEQVFHILLQVSNWWSGYYAEHFEGSSGQLNDEFSFTAGEGAHYSRQKLVELIPGKKIVWLVTESKLRFLDKQDEWTGSRIVFDILQEDNQTYVRFTHEGLTPDVECYDSCTPAWTQYLQGKLLPLLNPEKITDSFVQ